MINVLLYCAMGASSSIFEAKMNDYINESGIEMTIIAKASSDVKRLMKKNHYDVLLIAPQKSWELPNMKKTYEPTGTKVMAISPADYGAMNGEKVVKDIVEELRETE